MCIRTVINCLWAQSESRLTFFFTSNITSLLACNACLLTFYILANTLSHQIWVSSWLLFVKESGLESSRVSELRGSKGVKIGASSEIETASIGIKHIDIISDSFLIKSGQSLVCLPSFGITHRLLRWDDLALSPSSWTLGIDLRFWGALSNLAYWYLAHCIG